MKKIFGICFFVLMTGCILTHSSLSLAYAALGLNLWYEKMVPVLLPFMILSGTLIRMGMTDSLIRPVRPLFGRIFRLPGPGIYVILVGFLCGFPMGARRIYGTDRNFLRRKDNICWPSATIWDQSISWDLYCRYCIGSWCSPMYLVCMAFHCYMVFPCVIAYTEIGFQRKQTKLSEETTQRSF